MDPTPGNTVIREFEYRISEYLDSKYALAVCNATTGIMGVFFALGLSNAEVITTPLSWAGAFSGPMMLNCRFRFCDVEPEGLTINPDLIEALITPKTKAVFSADFLGYPAQLDKVKDICLKHNLLLIHDAASSFGSKHKGFYSGHFADVSVLSFGEKKIFSIGGGGCILTDNNSIYEKLVKRLTHPERQSLEVFGYNPFSLNTSMNPWAAKYGLETFNEQVLKIEKRKQEIIRSFKEIGMANKTDKSDPNYYKILVSPELQSRFEKGTLLNNLPFMRLVYNEPYYKYNKMKNYCPIAERAMCNYKTIDFTQFCNKALINNTTNVRKSVI